MPMLNFLQLRQLADRTLIAVFRTFIVFAMCSAKMHFAFGANVSIRTTRPVPAIVSPGRVRVTGGKRRDTATRASNGGVAGDSTSMPLELMLQVTPSLLRREPPSFQLKSTTTRIGYR